MAWWHKMSEANAIKTKPSAVAGQLERLVSVLIEPRPEMAESHFEKSLQINHLAVVI